MTWLLALSKGRIHFRDIRENCLEIKCLSITPVVPTILNTTKGPVAGNNETLSAFHMCKWSIAFPQRVQYVKVVHISIVTYCRRCLGSTFTKEAGFNLKLQWNIVPLGYRSQATSRKRCLLSFKFVLIVITTSKVKLVRGLLDH